MILDKFLADLKAKHAAMTKGEYFPYASCDGWMLVLDPKATYPTCVLFDQGTDAFKAVGRKAETNADGLAFEHGAFPLLLRIVERMRVELPTECKSSICEHHPCPRCRLRRDVEAIIEGAKP